MFNLSPPPQRSTGKAPRNRTSEIVTTSILVSLFLLIGISGLLWLTQSQIALRPTPTPTATASSHLTATPDFRVTRQWEDLNTRVAYLLTLQATPGTQPNENGPAIEQPTEVAIQPVSPIETSQPQTNTVSFPAIMQGEPANSPLATPTVFEVASADATQTTQPVSPIEIPTSIQVVLPTVKEGENGTFVTPTVEGPIVVIPTAELPTTPTPSLTDTETIPPTDTPTPAPPTSTPTFTPQPPTLAKMNAVATEEITDLRPGPSLLYQVYPVTLPANQAMTLVGRDASGEWVYGCCVSLNNSETSYWIRRVQIGLKGNSLPTGAAPSSTPEDVRWLPLQTPPSNLQPPPTPLSTAIPNDDFPFGQRDRWNTNRVPRIPSAIGGPTPLANGRAGGAYISSALVVGSAIYAASADNNIYSIDRGSGNQRWRYNMNEAVRAAMAFHDQVLFVIAPSGNLVALRDQGNTDPAVLWQKATTITGATALKVVNNRIFVVGTGHDPQSNGEGVYIFDRNTGAFVKGYPSVGIVPLPPLVGSGMTYATSTSTLFLLDVDNLSNIVPFAPSSMNDFNGRRAVIPLAYITPGNRTLAELYMVDDQGRLWLIDANTSEKLWMVGGAESASGMAIANQAIIVTGNNYMRAFARVNGQQLWSINLDGPVPGGPLTDGTRIFAITSNGAILIVDAASGAAITAPFRVQPGGAPAVSGNTIYIPAADGNLIAINGQ